MGSASKVLESSGVVGVGCVEVAEILENRSVGVTSRGEDEVVDMRRTEIQVSGSTATFLGGSSPHSEKTGSLPAVSSTSKSSKSGSQVRGSEWADCARASSQVISESSPPATAHSSSQSLSEGPAPAQFGSSDSIQSAYETLVQEEMLPQGFEPQFRSLCAAARSASLRVERKWARATPMQVGMLACKRTPRTHRSQSSFRCCTQGRRHQKKARSRLAQMVFSTATARQDAENAERIKWIACLSQLVAGTATPLLHWVRGGFNDQPKLPPWDSVYGRVP